jgi:hypothetical protein
MKGRNNGGANSASLALRRSTDGRSFGVAKLRPPSLSARIVLSGILWFRYSKANTTFKEFSGTLAATSFRGLYERKLSNMKKQNLLTKLTLLFAVLLTLGAGQAQATSFLVSALGSLLSA